MHLRTQVTLSLSVLRISYVRILLAREMEVMATEGTVVPLTPLVRVQMGKAESTQIKVVPDR